MKNFGFLDLALVQPTAPVGFEAVKYAKHSGEVLENALRAKTLAQAVAGFDFVVGTSGVPTRFGSRLKNNVLLGQLPALLAKREKTAIVFGRESTGLSKAELDACDAVCVIPTGSLHRVLNLSHAVGIVLYEVYQSTLSAGRIDSARLAEKKILGTKPASRENRQALELLFGKLVNQMPRIRDPEKVAASLRNMVERSRATDDEVRSLMAALSELQTGKVKGRPR
jgi:TrmH family RNA methyltransferase